MSVTVIAPRVPAAEKAALEDLIQSEGWQLYHAAMSDRWSPAKYEAEVRATLEADADPGVDVSGIVRQITSTYAAMRRQLEWPQRQIDMLSGAPAAKKVDPFKMFRRVNGAAR